MTKRLQVLFDEDEYREIKASAAKARMTVAAWVRQVLRRAQTERLQSIESKLGALSRASSHTYPISDIDELLEEIDRGRDLD